MITKMMTKMIFLFISFFAFLACDSLPSGTTLKSSTGTDRQFYVDPNSQAAHDLTLMRASNNSDAAYIEYIAKQGAGVWYGEHSGNVTEAVKRQVQGAMAQNAYAVIIPYNIPDRDCGQHSAGGLEPDQYRIWISDLATAIGSAKAFVILEPDALTLNDCMTEELLSERYELLRYAVDRLKTKSTTLVYIDAGHSNWLSAEEVSDRLQLAGVQMADGFALNTSNYETTDANTRYGQQIRSLLGDKGFVIDTSRNGNGPAADSEWCNPIGRALGQPPSTKTGVDGLDAYLWLKLPGESDGTCNGGPTAGSWWREMGIELAKNAGINESGVPTTPSERPQDNQTREVEFTASLIEKANWNDGACFDVLVKNNSSRALESYSLVINTHGAILDQKWNFTVSTDGANYVLESHFGIAAAGSAQNSGFCISGGSAKPTINSLR